MLKVKAPAKLNLILEIVNKRNDGYHEIRSLIQTINLYDILTFEPSDVISLKTSIPELDLPNNLILQAAELLKKVYNVSAGAKINLKKIIPWSAGLGGGSSNAAATLQGLNKSWRLNVKTEELMQLAAQLGSDVPFFIFGNIASVEGRGEKVTPLTVPLLPQWFVLLVPPFVQMPDKTRKAYSLIRKEHFTSGEICDHAIKDLSNTNILNLDLLFNVFDQVAFEIWPQLKEYWKALEQARAKNIHLAGSGPALFAPVADVNEGNRIRNHLTGLGFMAYTVSSDVYFPISPND